MTTVVVILVGLVGYELMRRSSTFKGRLTVALVFLVWIGLIVASDL